MEPQLAECPKSMCVSEGTRSDGALADLQPRIPVSQPEAAVGCAASRRHGRFLVQPLMEASLSATPTSARAPSPGGRPPLAPSKLQSSPTPSALVSERRPSRIIGRFEVCELFESDAAQSPPCKSVNLVHSELISDMASFKETGL